VKCGGGPIRPCNDACRKRAWRLARREAENDPRTARLLATIKRLRAEIKELKR
jgi:hypothetical protein